MTTRRRRIKHIYALPGFFAVVATSLAGTASGQGSGSAERGAAVVAQWCTGCHATGTNRRAADVGPTFPDIVRSRSPDYLRGFLANPHVRGLMPPFEIGNRQVEDIVAYLQTLK